MSCCVAGWGFLCFRVGHLSHSSRSLSGPTELKFLSLVVIVPWNGPLFQNVALPPVCGPFLAAARLLTLIRSLPGACLAPGTSGLQTWEGPPVVFPASPSCSFLPRFSGPWGRGSSPRVAHPVSTLSPRSHSWKGRGCHYCLGCSRASPRSGWFCGPAAVTGDHRAESDGLYNPSA